MWSLPPRAAGHIPGAVNVPYARLVDASGRFLPAGEMARAFSDAGVDVAALPREVIVYCNGGVSCTVPLSALRMLGRDDVAVYDGSWNEWGADAASPSGPGASRSIAASPPPIRGGGACRQTTGTAERAYRPHLPSG